MYKRYYIPVLLSLGQTNSTGQPCIQCCVCSITTVSVMAAVTGTFLAFNLDGKHSLFNHIFNSTKTCTLFSDSDSDIDIGRSKRSIGYPQDGKALYNIPAIFHFLCQVSPTVVMFALAITTSCKQFACEIMTMREM